MSIQFRGLTLVKGGKEIVFVDWATLMQFGLTWGELNAAGVEWSKLRLGVAVYPELFS